MSNLHIALLLHETLPTFLDDGEPSLQMIIWSSKIWNVSAKWPLIGALGETSLNVTAEKRLKDHLAPIVVAVAKCFVFGALLNGDL